MARVLLIIIVLYYCTSCSNADKEKIEAEYNFWRGRKIEIPDNITFVKDISAVLQECKAYISFAYLAQITGISKVMLSQYACGTRKPKATQRERIVGGIHQIGQTCLQIGVR